MKRPSFWVTNTVLPSGPPKVGLVGRLPSSGTCYAPDTYNPQAECRERTTKK